MERIEKKIIETRQMNGINHQSHAIYLIGRHAT